MPPTILIPVAPGELVDKITILEIKAERMTDAAKITNVRRELELLKEVRGRSVAASPELDGLTRDLKRANETLWEIEDAIRRCEQCQDFGERFVELARAVYVNNDRRALLKRRINELLGSSIVEEKEYVEYAPR
jgi:hypothetical protein